MLSCIFVESNTSKQIQSVCFGQNRDTAMGLELVVDTMDCIGWPQLAHTLRGDELNKNDGGCR